MNKKRLLVFFLTSLLLTSFLFSIVSAQTTDTLDPAGELTVGDQATSSTTTSTTADSWTWQKFRALPWVSLWYEGYNAKNFSIAGELVKSLLLVLVIVLVYTSMSYVNFPSKESGFLKTVISIIVGLLATFLVSTEALMTSLTSFTALGTALWIFLPILILAFFTIMVSSAAAPFGIFLQKILWVIYSVYTFISGIVILILVQAKVSVVSGLLVTKTGGFGLEGVSNVIVKYIIRPLYGGNSTLLGNMAKNADGPTAVILIIVSIAVFWIAVVKGDFLDHWFLKEKRDADVMKLEDEVKRQSKKRAIEAEDTK